MTANVGVPSTTLATSVQRLSTSKTVAGEPVLDDLVACGGVVVEVDTVTGVWLDVGLESRGIWEVLADSSWDASSDTAGSQAITTAVDVVVLTSEDLNWTLEGVEHWSTVCEGEDLAGSHWLLGHLTKDTDSDVKVVWKKESEDVGGKVRPGEVSVRVVQWNLSLVPAVDDVANLGGGDFLPDIRRGKVNTNVAQTHLNGVDERALDVLTPVTQAALVGLECLVAKSQRLVKTSEVQVPVSKSLGQPSTVHRETSQDNSVTGSRVQSAEKVGLG